MVLLLGITHMDPLTFLEKVGRPKADEVAKRAKLSPAYFNQICYGHRRASFAAAERLVKASGKKMGLLAILRHKVPRTRNGVRAS